MTTLRDIFEKPVDRAIEGVIKADDEASLRVELEEYVITNEIERQLEKFLDAYNNYGTANGVWISGFFGSGKSHLLKMLALLLENRDVGGSPAYELFKQKCAHNEILAADLTLDAKCQRLVGLANERGGRDNISVVIVKAHEPPKKSGVMAKLLRK